MPRTKTWSIQTAKAEFAALVRAAEEHGPQPITRHGETVAVVLSAREFARLQLRERRGSLVDFLSSAPLIEPPERHRGDVTSEITL